MLTTTAELVDVFASKREGVLRVLDAAEQALPGRRLRVFTTAGEMVDLEHARAAPLACAAANWVATAMLVARSLPDAILLDCGGTTTDVIPIVAGTVAALGRTDVERLLEGELVYTGALRTNVAAVRLARADRRQAVRGDRGAVRDRRRCASAARQSHGPSSARARSPTVAARRLAEVRSRLARVVCADPEQLADGDLEAIAAAVEEAQIESIADALARVAERVPAGTEWSPSGSANSWPARRPTRCGLSVHADSDSPLVGQGGEVAAAVALSVLGRD